VSGPSSLPTGSQLKAGPGITIDASNNISVDPATAHAADSDQLGGVAAASYPTTAAADAKYLAKTAQAADSARLGGVAPTSFAVKDSGGNVDLGGGRVVLTFGTGANAASTSAFGLFCGTSAATTGAVAFTSGMTTTNGYQGSKKTCEAVAGCGPLAHMCRPAEMMASLEVGAVNFTNFGANTSLWVASGVHWEGSGGPVPIGDDCIGYTSGAAGTGELGATFIIKPGSVTGNAGIPGKSACNTSNSIACCQ
jgi:hypothetical protein